MDLLEKRMSGRRGQAQGDKWKEKEEGREDRERGDRRGGGMMLFCQCFPVGTRLLVKKS